jgi:hypothetical protein
VHSPLSAALHADRATALLRLKQWQPCRTDALRALAAQNDCKVSATVFDDVAVSGGAVNVCSRVGSSCWRITGGACASLGV